MTRIASIHSSTEPLELGPHSLLNLVFAPASTMAAGCSRPGAVRVSSFDIGQGIRQDSWQQSAERQQPAGPYPQHNLNPANHLLFHSHCRTGLTTRITSVYSWKTSSPCWAPTASTSCYCRDGLSLHWIASTMFPA